MLTTNQLLVTALRFRWVRPVLTGFGILGALANALIHLHPLLSHVPLYTTLAMVCTFWAWIGAWLALISVWHEIIISRQIHWLGASIGVILILIPSLVTFDSPGGPTLNAIDLSMLIGLAIETIVVCLTLPLWSILLTRALHRH